MTLRILGDSELAVGRLYPGQHSLWSSRDGLKIPFQWGGRITKYSRPGEPTYDLGSLRHEIAILRALATGQMAPPIGQVVFGKVLSSQYPGAWWSDPCGAYGYEMADARTLPPGRFSLDAMRRLPIDGSEGAWNDIGVPERRNVVNGYLVDVRRTAWDMLRWTGELPELPRYIEDAAALRARVRRDCAFPAGERSEPYLDYYLNGAWHRGSRRVIERARLLGFLPLTGESVVDLGCQAGGFLQRSWIVQAGCGTPGLHVGIDCDEKVIACARDLARASGQNLCYRQADLADAGARAALLAWLRELFGERGPDHLLALSIEKHIGEAALWELVDGIGARRTYLETHAQREGVYALRVGVEARGGVYLGDSTDRNVRRLYRIHDLARGKSPA